MRSDDLDPVGERPLHDGGRFDAGLQPRLGQRIALGLRTHGQWCAGGFGQRTEGRERRRIGPFGRIFLALLIGKIYSALRIEPFGGGTLHILDGHCCDCLQALVRGLGIAGRYQRLAQLKRAAARSLAAAQCAGEYLILGFAQLGRGHRGRANLGELGIKDRLHLGGIGRGVGDRKTGDHPGLFSIIIEEAGLDRLAGPYQRLVETAIVAARHDRGKHFERGRVLRCGFWTLPQGAADRQRDIRRPRHDRARFGALWLFGRQFERHGVLAAWDIGKIFVHHRA